MKTSEQLNELAAALSKAQGEIRNPGKDKTAVVEMKGGGKYSYTYGDLASLIDAIRKPFADNGLSYIQVPTNVPGEVSVTTRLMHSSGQWLEDVLIMPVADNRPQTLGSAITYARRYMLGAMAGVASEQDDDGAAAQEAATPPPRQSSAKKAPQERREAPPVDINKELYRGTAEQREALRGVFATLPDLSNDDKHAIAGKMAGAPMSELQAVVDRYLKREDTNAAQ